MFKFIKGPLVVTLKNWVNRLNIFLLHFLSGTFNRRYYTYYIRIFRVRIVGLLRIILLTRYNTLKINYRVNSVF